MKLLLITLFALSTLLSGEKPYEDLLAKNGFVILDETYKQGFEPYIDSNEPVFITTDSLLMAFHRLLEQYLFQFDLAQMSYDRKTIPLLWKNLPLEPREKTEASEEGLKLCRLTLGTAHRLLFGILPEGLNNEERALITSEVKKVENAEGDNLPAWLKSEYYPVTTVVRYSLYRPTGPWTGNPTYRNYYRFRKWLQETPLTSADPSHENLKTYYQETQQGRNLPNSTYFYSGLEERDHLNLFSSFSSSSDSPIFYLRDSEKIPESKIITTLLQNNKAQRAPEAVAGAVGSQFSPSGLTKAFPEGFTLPVENYPYFQLLASLFEQKDPRIPEQFRSPAWQRKLLNTSCASWAEWTYARQLKTKETVMILAAIKGPSPGFIEPAPAFYRQLSQLAESLARRHEVSRRDFHSDADQLFLLQKAIANVERYNAADQDWTFEDYYDPDNKLLVSLLEHFIRTSGRHKTISQLTGQEVLSYFNLSLERYAQNDSEVVAIIRANPQSASTSIDSKFWRLALLASRLELLCEHQLQGREWTDSEREFFRDYKAYLGNIMFYEQVYKEYLRDDAPRIARYATGVLPGEGATLFHAAIARPRKIIVRYPKPDGTHLDCVGSVYAFRQHTAAQTPTNDEWAETCKTSPWPDWMKPIVIEQ